MDSPDLDTPTAPPIAALPPMHAGAPWLDATRQNRAQDCVRDLGWTGETA